MVVSPETIENQAMQLPLEDRSRLAAHLLESIESRHRDSNPKAVEQAWLAEAERRYQAYLRGEEKAIPAEAVFSELRKDDD